MPVVLPSLLSFLVLLGLSAAAAPMGLLYDSHFLATAPDKTAWNKTTAYLHRWLEKHNMDVIKDRKNRGRIHPPDFQPAFVDYLWNALIGSKDQRLDMLRLDTHPDWTPVAFSESLVPCVYFKRNAAFPMHRDEKRMRPGEAANLACLKPAHAYSDPPAPACDTLSSSSSKEVRNLAKLVLYPEPFKGGDFVLYTNGTDPNQNITISPLPGAAVVFDLDYQHASLPLQSEQKLILGIRVLYTKDR